MRLAAGRQGQRIEDMQRETARPRDITDIGLREMVAHLNVIEASIDAVGSGQDIGPKARDVLSRLQLLAFSATRLRIAEVTRVTDALEELVLALNIRGHRCDGEVRATLRHGVDVLLLLTHDKMRRVQGYPAADLRPAADALIERVDRVITHGAAIPRSGLKLAGL
jgi:hypothetical protein